jgi:hypothetical protein
MLAPWRFSGGDGTGARGAEALCSPLLGRRVGCLIVAMTTARTTEAVAAESPGETSVPSLRRSVKPLVFVSHDSRDADLAEAFGNLLTDASGGTLKSFRSSDRKGTAGIEFGSEWYKAIMDRLSDATDVVALLTQHSLNRPWILYEAGVAKGKLDTIAFGVALGIPLEKASTGPFAQFQNCGDDEDSLTKLVLQLIKRNPDADPREAAVRRQVQAFRSNLDSLAKGAAKTAPSPADRVDATAVAKLFEEVKVLFRDLPGQVEAKLQATVPQPGTRRRLRLHPAMFDEIFFSLRRRESPGGEGLPWLVWASVFREELPWLHELALELYRAISCGDERRVGAVRRDLRAALEMARRGPFMDAFLGRDEETYMVVRHCVDMLDRVLDTSEVPDGGPRMTDGKKAPSPQKK